MIYDPKEDRSSYRDKSGNFLTVLEWAERFEDFDYRLIGRDYFSDGKCIVTVWMGTVGLDGVMFESALLNGNELGMTRFLKILGRWDTLEEAERMHKELVEEYAGSESGEVRHDS